MKATKLASEDNEEIVIVEMTRQQAIQLVDFVINTVLFTSGEVYARSPDPVRGALAQDLCTAMRNAGYA